MQGGRDFYVIKGVMMEPLVITVSTTVATTVFTTLRVTNRLVIVKEGVTRDIPMMTAAMSVHLHIMERIADNVVVDIV